MVFLFQNYDTNLSWTISKLKFIKGQKSKEFNIFQETEWAAT